LSRLALIGVFTSNPAIQKSLQRHFRK